MRNTTASSRVKGASLLLPILLLVLSGCIDAGSKIAPDLLVNMSTNSKPLTCNSSTVNVTINPSINNYEKLDESVKRSLEIALANANIFGSVSSQPYRIDANILLASQSPMSFGSFKGKLEIKYVVHDPNGNQFIQKTIHTVAESDKSGFGPVRHRRARAVNISKNVLQFVDILQSQLKE